LARNVTLQPKILPQIDPLKIAELARSLCHSGATCYYRNAQNVAQFTFWLLMSMFNGGRSGLSDIWGLAS